MCIRDREKVANDGDNYKKFRFGGYGEMVASFKDYGINRFYGAPEEMCIRDRSGCMQGSLCYFGTWFRSSRP